jgi:hypothetical protein
MANKPFLLFNINELAIGAGGNTMKITMLKNFLK